MGLQLPAQGDTVTYRWAAPPGGALCTLWGRCRRHLWLLPQVVIPTGSWPAGPSDQETEVWPTCPEGKWAPWTGLWAGALGEVSAVGIAGHKQPIFLGFTAWLS